MTLEVDDTDAGSIARELQNLGVGTYLHDNAVADSNGLGNRIICIHGEDVTVTQDEVGRDLCRKSPGKQQRSQEHA